MPNTIISEGKTTNEAIEKGLKKLKVDKSQVNIKVLENEDKRSFFSILAPRVVKVEISLKEEQNNINVKEENRESKKELRNLTKEEFNIAEKNLKEFLDEFINKLQNNITYSISESDSYINIDLNGENINFLIGYRGETLYALQNILASVASKDLSFRVRIILNISGYKEKREKALQELAEKIAKTVLRTKKSVTLEPMQAYERKIIHSQLQNYSKISTKSIGEEPRRRIVISLKQ